MHVCVLCYRSFSITWNVGFCWYLNPSFFSRFINILPFHWEVMVPYEPSSWVCVKSPMKKNSSSQTFTYINQTQDRPSLLWLNWVQYDLKFGKCKVWHILSTLKVSAVKNNLKEVLRKINKKISPVTQKTIVINICSCFSKKDNGKSRPTLKNWHYYFPKKFLLRRKWTVVCYTTMCYITADELRWCIRIEIYF